MKGEDLLNRSDFTKEKGYKIDNFPELAELPPQYIQKAVRLTELRMKSNRTPEENEEMLQLSKDLVNYEISPEVWNWICDAMKNMQTYLKVEVFDDVEAMKQDVKIHTDNMKLDVKTYTDNKKTEMNIYSDGIKRDVNNYVDGKKQEITLRQTDAVNEMLDKKNLYILLVNQKLVELSELDTRVERYYQKWIANTNGQSEFDIFTGGTNTSLPNSALLNIRTTDIDCMINGVPQVPFENFEIKNDGTFKKIIIKGDTSRITIGTEIFIQYYKNVGKLYFPHASTHMEGGTDPLKISRGMIDDSLKQDMGHHIGQTAPTSPCLLWFQI